MNVILCLDDNNGMLFHNRRQSRDEKVCEYILRLSEGSKLLMNGYSAKLFSDACFTVSEQFLNEAQYGDFCFVENCDIMSYKNRIENIYVFRWNRVYPADFHFPQSLLAENKQIISEFPGKSHERISLEVYYHEKR